MFKHWFSDEKKKPKKLKGLNLIKELLSFQLAKVKNRSHYVFHYWLNPKGLKKIISITCLKQLTHINENKKHENLS